MQLQIVRLTGRGAAENSRETDYAYKNALFFHCHNLSAGGEGGKCCWKFLRNNLLCQK